MLACSLCLAFIGAKDSGLNLDPVHESDEQICSLEINESAERSSGYRYILHLHHVVDGC